MSRLKLLLLALASCIATGVGMEHAISAASAQSVASSDASSIAGRLAEVRASTRQLPGGTGLVVEVAMANAPEQRLLVDNWSGGQDVDERRALLAMLATAVASSAEITLEFRDLPHPSGGTARRLEGVALRPASAAPASTQPMAAPTPAPGPPLGVVLRDAATRLGVGQETLRIERSEPVQWGGVPSCHPQTSAADQQPTRGYMISVIGAAHMLHYQTDEHGRFALCQVSMYDPPPGWMP